MRAEQGICVLRHGILGHFRPLLDIFGAKGLFKGNFLFEGRGCVPPPPLDAPLRKKGWFHWCCFWFNCIKHIICNSLEGYVIFIIMVFYKLATMVTYEHFVCDSEVIKIQHDILMNIRTGMQVKCESHIIILDWFIPSGYMIIKYLMRPCFRLFYLFGWSQGSIRFKILHEPILNNLVFEKT